MKLVLAQNHKTARDFAVREGFDCWKYISNSAKLKGYHLGKDAELAYHETWYLHSDLPNISREVKIMELEASDE